MKRLRRVKPGWYVLLALFIYALFATAALSRSNVALRDLRTVLVGQTLSAPLAPPSLAPPGLWFPVTGAGLPQDAAHWPGAPRSDRQGVSQGFEFHGGDAGVPIGYGTPVIAADDATLLRVDYAYQEPDVDAWAALLAEVGRNGADEAQLDRLHGRQVWLGTDAGLELRYGHLSGIREGLTAGQRVYRGQVLGYVGDSGTPQAASGKQERARLHFGIWRPDGTFFGEGQDQAALRAQAASVFVGP